MIEVAYALMFAERIESPLGPTIGSPPRLCWHIAGASLDGPRVAATLAMPGTDWIRLQPRHSPPEPARAVPHR